MNFKRLLLTTGLSFFVSTFIFAVPARPGKRTVTLPDGTSITVTQKGDERAGYYETEDGLLVLRKADGYFYYGNKEKGRVIAGDLKAKSKELRSESERQYISSIDQAALRTLVAGNAQADGVTRLSPGNIRVTFPTVGEVRGLVVLAEYDDVRFREGIDIKEYDDVMNKPGYEGELATGSVFDYFYAQSEGKLSLKFDVVGPVTLSLPREYYGGSSLGSERVAEMTMEAVKLAKEQNPELDFSQYDKNNDGDVDFIYIIYAGHGEAQGGPVESVWPQASSLAYTSWDQYDGLYLGAFACSCELSGGVGAIPDGIGTFVHEFSHILGLPDLYDVAYSGYYGMGYWDVMDVGSYNNSSKTPPNYSAFERYSLGWHTPSVLDEAGDVQLNPGESRFIISPKDNNQYFLLENRQHTGWDVALPGHGMLVSRIHYDRIIWSQNRVNTTMGGHEHLKLIAANNDPSANTAANLFPGTNNVTSFTDTTSPAMEWVSGEKAGTPVTEITESEEGIITFRYRGGSASSVSSALNAETRVSCVDGKIMITNPKHEYVVVTTPAGRVIYTGSGSEASINVEKGIYIITADGESRKLIVR